jgi:RNA polymerase sigma-70 factor (ECF subfamily)
MTGNHTSAGLHHALTQLAQGSQDAWETIANTCGYDINRLAQRMTRSTALADDTVQETLLHLRRAAEHFIPRSAEDDDGARRWIMLIAARTALNVARRQGRERSRNQRVGVISSQGSDDSPLRMIESQEQSAIIERELALLPDAYRLPVLLRFHHEFEISAMATELGVPLVTARVRLHRALRMLRRRLERFGLTYFVALVEGGRRVLLMGQGRSAIALMAHRAFLAGACCSLIALSCALVVPAMPKRASSAAPVPAAQAPVIAQAGYRRIHGLVSAVAADGTLTIDNRENGAQEQIQLGSTAADRQNLIHLDGGAMKPIAMLKAGDVVDFSMQDSQHLEARTFADGHRRVVSTTVEPAHAGTRAGVIESNAADKIRLRFDDGGVLEFPVPVAQRNDFTIWRPGNRVRLITDKTGNTTLENQVSNADALAKYLKQRAVPQ